MNDRPLLQRFRVLQEQALERLRSNPDYLDRDVLTDLVSDTLEVALKAFAADIWDEGFDAGEEDIRRHEAADYDTPCIENPYKDNA